MIFFLVYAFALMVAALLGAACLVIIAVLLILPKTRTMGLVALLSSVAGVVVVVGLHVLVLFILSDVFPAIHPLWILAGVAAGAVPSLAVTGFGKAVLGLLRFRQDAAIRSASLAPDKRE